MRGGKAPLGGPPPPQPPQPHAAAAAGYADSSTPFAVVYHGRIRISYTYLAQVKDRYPVPALRLGG
eukprot:1015377-Prymnesium_polylepis.1